MTGRQTILLGAGASIDAGLPGSWQLTQRLADRFNTHNAYDRRHRATFNAVAGAIIAFDSARGGSAFDAVDIERLFSSVEMLADRDAVELTPFVASWQPGIESVGTDLPSSFGREFQRAIFDEHFSTSKIEQIFKQGYRALSGGASSRAFASLREELVLALREVLTVDPSNLEYLKPLVEVAGKNGVTVATLNYDRSVEVTAGTLGLKSDLGVGTWAGGLDWEWSEPSIDTLRILKLHGSVDWAYRKPSHYVPTLREDSAVDVLDLDGSDRYDRRPPGIVFGQRGKLRSEGPFLAMLVEFAKVLSTTDRLVVIGYSFRDAHINSLIRTWFLSRADPSVVLVDPAAPKVTDVWRGQANSSKFLSSLIEEMHEKPDWAKNPSGDPPVTVKGNHQILRTTAGEAISGLFSP